MISIHSSFVNQQYESAMCIPIGTTSANLNYIQASKANQFVKKAKQKNKKLN